MSKPSRILVVDDDKGIAKGLVVRLRATGREVFVATDGETGIERARFHHPHVILLDLRMQGMDGFEVMRVLRDDPTLAKIAVIVLSANVVEESRQRVHELGAKYFFSKPYDARELLAAIDSLDPISVVRE